MCLPRKIALPSLLSRRLCFWKEGRAKTLPLLIVISITLLNYFFATRAIMPKNWTRQILLTKRHIFDAMLIATNTTLDCPSFVKLKAPGVTACGYLALFTPIPRRKPRPSGLGRKARLIFPIKNAKLKT